MHALRLAELRRAKRHAKLATREKTYHHVTRYKDVADAVAVASLRRVWVRVAIQERAHSLNLHTSCVTIFQTRCDTFFSEVTQSLSAQGVLFSELDQFHSCDVATL
jgi:hypothetical protein